MFGIKFFQKKASGSTTPTGSIPSLFHCRWRSPRSSHSSPHPIRWAWLRFHHHRIPHPLLLVPSILDQVSCFTINFNNLRFFSNLGQNLGSSATSDDSDPTELVEAQLAENNDVIPSPSDIVTYIQYHPCTPHQPHYHKHPSSSSLKLLHFLTPL